MFKPGADVPTNYGPNRNWNVDLIPKFVMAGGKFWLKYYDTLESEFSSSL